MAGRWIPTARCLYTNVLPREERSFGVAAEPPLDKNRFLTIKSVVSVFAFILLQLLSMTSIALLANLLRKLTAGKCSRLRRW